MEYCNFSFKKREKKIKQTLTDFLTLNGAKNVSIEYYPKIFGNIVLTIQYNQLTYEFITDRGEIYLNKKFICDVSREEDQITKLMEVISDFLFKAKKTEKR